jgi:hypothetical protein
MKASQLLPTDKNSETGVISGAPLVLPQVLLGLTQSVTGRS